MPNSLIKRLQESSLDYDRVRECFLEHWHTVYTIGEVSYLSLFGGSMPIYGNNELLAFMLIGAAQVFAASTHDVPGNAIEYWEAVQFLIEDLLPDGADFSEPNISITYAGSET